MSQAVQKSPTGNEKKQTESRKAGNAAKKRFDLPFQAGIVVMAILLAASLFVGNFRALQSVTPAAFLQGDVKSYVEDRITQAGNAETVAKRVNLDSAVYSYVDSAIEGLKTAKSAREISRANQTLTDAVSRMASSAADALDAEGQKMLSRAVDSFTEEGSFLRQEAKSYNQKAEKAQQLYSKLPTRFLLPEPDYYEGI